MINTQHVETLPRNRYPDLEVVGKGVFRGVDRFGSRDYAVRYFDLNDRLKTIAGSLKGYQEEVLSQMYFSGQVATDLRWSHYLYFVTSDQEAQQAEFGSVKAKIEADREYARKQVVREDDLPRLLAKEGPLVSTSALPVDLATTWSDTLELHGLGYILDEDISVPDAVRRIIAGTKEKASRPVSQLQLLPGERAAAAHFLKRLTISGFRPHPEQKDHPLGRVNLVVGSNGVGKTSLLEAIEFGYCGRNRRSAVLLNGTSIGFEFAGANEKLKSTTDSARLRARHSNWYAKTDLKKVTIQDSFGKFNFLDTDAAVNLSVSGSSAQIGADVTRLLLGAAAENLSDRLRRVLEKLQDELKNFRRDITANNELKLAAQRRVDAIKTAPMLSDSLFAELIAALEALGWIQNPEDKMQTGDLREGLREAASATELLRRSSPNMLRGDPESALQLLAYLKEEASKAVELNERAKAGNLARVKTQREAEAATERIARIEELLPYARIDYARLISEAQEREHVVRTRGARLAFIANSVHPNTVESMAALPISEAIATVEIQANEHQRRGVIARSSLEAIEKTQNSLTTLRQRLLSIAQDMLQRVPNPDHCPLCRTEFQSGELLARMTTDVVGNTSEQAGLLQVEIATASEGLASAHAALTTLRYVDTFLAGRTQTFTVSEALAQIEQEKAEFEIERLNLEAAQNQIQQIQADGLSSERLSKGLMAAGLSDLPPLDALKNMHSEHNDALQRIQNSTQVVFKELHDVQQACETLAARLAIPIDDNSETLVTTLKAQVSDLEVALGARQILASLLATGEDKTANELAIDLAAAQQLLAKMATSIAQESANNATLNKEVKEVADLVLKIETYNMKMTHLTNAGGVLEALTQQSSGVELTNRILTENAQEIARTFASIHMPNEFELKTELGRLGIIRRRTGEEVQLDQMSTGQRAAFALSLFLAMNGRLRTGPPVLLFDDPVAHVDDINVLSFLDHLRHLAISGNRQIFFATADTKLAGLFRHKFRFLGDDFKELVLSRN